MTSQWKSGRFGLPTLRGRDRLGMTAFQLWVSDRDPWRSPPPICGDADDHCYSQFLPVSLQPDSHSSSNITLQSRIDIQIFFFSEVPYPLVLTSGDLSVLNVGDISSTRSRSCGYLCTRYSFSTHYFSCSRCRSGGEGHVLELREHLVKFTIIPLGRGIQWSSAHAPNLFGNPVSGNNSHQ